MRFPKKLARCDKVAFICPGNSSKQKRDYNTMAECVACHQPLEVEVEVSDDEDVQMGESSSSAANKNRVPDDVHLVISTSPQKFCSLTCLDRRTADAISIGTVFWKHIKSHHVPIARRN